MAKKRIRRWDLVAKSQERPGQTTHGAYTAARKVKEGHLPPGNTNLRKALDEIEISIHRDFGPLNALQATMLNLLRPLLVWWLLHPGTTEKGDLAHDFKWIHTKIESGLKRIAELGGRMPKESRVPSLDEYLKTTYGGDKKQ